METRRLEVGHMEAPKPPRHPEHLCPRKGSGEGRPLPSPPAEPKLCGETRGQRVVCPSPLAPTDMFVSSLPARLHPATSPKRLRLPGTRLAQPPSSPAKAWHRCPRQPLSLPASPRGPRARADCFTAAGSAQLPREKAPLFPAPVAPAWLGDTGAPGCKVTGPRRIHLQPHQLPGNRIPAADDSRRLQDRAPIQPPLEPAWPDLAATSPTWALPRLGTGFPEPALPRPPARPGPRPGTEGCDVPYPGCPGQGSPLSEQESWVEQQPLGGRGRWRKQPRGPRSSRPAGCSLMDLMEAVGDRAQPPTQKETISLPTGSPAAKSPARLAICGPDRKRGMEQAGKRSSSHPSSSQSPPLAWLPPPPSPIKLALPPHLHLANSYTLAKAQAEGSFLPEDVLKGPPNVAQRPIPTDQLYCSPSGAPWGSTPAHPHSEYYPAPFTQQKRKAQMGRECALHADERGLAAAGPAGRRPRTRSRQGRGRGRRGGGEEGRGGGPSPHQRAAGHERAPSGPDARRGGGEGAAGLEAGGGQGTPAQAGPSHPDARAPPQDGTRGGQPETDARAGLDREMGQATGGTTSGGQPASCALYLQPQQEPSCPHRPPPPRGEEDPSGPRLPAPTALRRGGSDQTAQRCRDPSGLPGQSPGTSLTRSSGEPSATFTCGCAAAGTEPGSVGDITGAPADSQAWARGLSRPLTPDLPAQDLCQHSDRLWAGGGSRKQSCDCSPLRDIPRLNERGPLCRRGFAIWLRGAGKNGPLCVRPGRGGAGRASRAEPGARRRVRSGRHGRGRTSGRGMPSGRARGPGAGTDAGSAGPAPRRLERGGRADGRTGDQSTTDGRPAPPRGPRARAGRGPRRGPALRLQQPHSAFPPLPADRRAQRGRGPEREPPARRRRARGRGAPPRAPSGPAQLPRGPAAASPLERPAPRAAVPSGSQPAGCPSPTVGEKRPEHIWGPATPPWGDTGAHEAEDFGAVGVHLGRGLKNFRLRFALSGPATGPVPAGAHLSPIGARPRAAGVWVVSLEPGTQ
ncbi:collagen alpha-1(I) chain-like [Eubalaena glacialis]|uniref:collagen alpha-1(I) chain-like n=1 Tax=Eubalaena glacialis TaxID=27606 RepID=UPI002A5A9254|nr:collagen alpha-1(I) chain-like [Eubalaena glacialis]